VDSKIYALAAGDENYKINYLVPDQHKTTAAKRSLNITDDKFVNVFVVDKKEEVIIKDKKLIQEIHNFFKDRNSKYFQDMVKLNLITVKPENKKHLLSYIHDDKNLYDLTNKGDVINDTDIFLNKRALICECTYNVQLDAFELK